MTTSSQPPRAEREGSEAASATGAVRIVKRYSNRKLYDTVESRYVTLPQIAELVRRGEDVRIIDNNTKEDLTSMTMAQILYEEERKQSQVLPLGALKDLIYSSGERLMSSLREGPVGKLIGSRQEAASKGTPPASETAQQGEESAEATKSATRDGKPRIQEMLEQSRGALEGLQHRVDERVRKVIEGLSPAAQIEKLQAEIRRLSKRIEELEARLAARGGRKDSSDPE